MHSKQATETLKAWKSIFGEIESLSRLNVESIRTDNGSEFLNHLWFEFNTSQRITHEASAPYTPQKNGVAERTNRTLVESARSMIHARDLPLTLWCEAMHTAAYVRNRVGSKVLGWKTPFECLTDKVPNVSNLVPFGTVAYASPHDAMPAKFEAKEQKFIVIGYDTHNKKTYRLYDGRSVIVRTDVIINHQEPQSPVAEPKEEPVVRTKTIAVADDPETEKAA
jgi:hypothetical protein